MRITTFLLLLAIGAYFVQGFNQPKCEHVYTAIEQPEIKIEQGLRSVHSIYTVPPTGKREGPELICVKCFHKQRQVLDYGQSHGSSILTLGADTLFLLNNTLPCIDNVHRTTTEYRPFTNK
jgi:hypothetical protein